MHLGPGSRPPIKWYIRCHGMQDPTGRTAVTPTYEVGQSRRPQLELRKQHAAARHHRQLAFLTKRQRLQNTKPSLQQPQHCQQG